MRKSLILLAALAAPLPAAAADLSTLGCVADKLPLLAKAQVEIDVERNLRESGKRPSYDAKLTAAIKAATEACAAAHRWPAEALQPAALYTRARLGWGVAQRVASERGFDPAILEAVWLTLPEEVRNAPLDSESYRLLADGALPEGDERRTSENGEFLSEFFSFLSVIQYCSMEFARAGEPEPPAPEADSNPPPESPPAEPEER